MTTATILLIDDAPHIREVLRVALEAEGYQVIEAADGREGVARSNWRGRWPIYSHATLESRRVL